MVARIDRNGELALLGFEDPAAQLFMAAVPAADRERSWQLILPDGRRLMAGEAVIELMRSLNRLEWLGNTLRALHLTGLVEVMYRAVSSVRPRLGRMVKDLPGPRRLP